MKRRQRTTLAIVVAIGIAIFVAVSQGNALTLAECERTTHISHGGERNHRDLGNARVLYAEWWSQEGVYLDLVIADCAAGRALTTRTREEFISQRPPFDRTAKAIDIIETELTAAPALFSLERLATALHPIGRDIEIADLTADPCACAALYPEHRGDRQAFELSQ
ncbi:MAG: hypothetical protein AAGA87_08530 [Pseudomonadota bacterium]